MGHGLNVRPARHDVVIALGSVGDKAGGTVFYPVGGVSEMSAAAAAKGIKRAIAEQAVEAVTVGSGVAGEILAFCVGEKAEMLVLIHNRLL